MTTAGQRPVTTAFAPPPPLWKHFTPDNLNKLEEIKKESSKDERGNLQKRKWTPAELRTLDLPPELRCLVPPEIPKTGYYSVFGELQSVCYTIYHFIDSCVCVCVCVSRNAVYLQFSTALPSLKEQGIEQLYPSNTDEGRESPSKASRPLNSAYYLLKISKSLLLNFLEFVGVLSVSPERFESKVDDLRNLFINAHHLLNLYRPHQARESLILMMEEQRDRTREEIRQMDKVKADIEGALEQLSFEGVDTDPGTQAAVEASSKPANTDEDAADESRLLWDLLDQDT